MEHKLWKKPTNFSAGTYPLTKKIPFFTNLHILEGNQEGCSNITLQNDKKIIIYLMNQNHFFHKSIYQPCLLEKTRKKSK